MLGTLAEELKRLQPIDSETAREIGDLQDEIKRLVVLCEEGKMSFVNVGIELCRGRLSTLAVVLREKKD